MVLPSGKYNDIITEQLAVYSERFVNLVVTVPTWLQSYKFIQATKNIHHRLSPRRDK